MAKKLTCRTCRKPLKRKAAQGPPPTYCNMKCQFAGWQKQNPRLRLPKGMTKRMAQAWLNSWVPPRKKVQVDPEVVSVEVNPQPFDKFGMNG